MPEKGKKQTDKTRKTSKKRCKFSLSNLRLYKDIIAIYCSLKPHWFPFAIFLFHFLFTNTNCSM